MKQRHDEIRQKYGECSDSVIKLKDILDLNQTEQTPDTFSSAMFNYLFFCHFQV